MANVKIVRKEIFPYVERIFKRRHLDFMLRKSPDEEHVAINIYDTSGKDFHRIIARAVCEKRNYEENLPENTTYWKPGTERKNEILAETPEYTFFKKM